MRVRIFRQSSKLYLIPSGSIIMLSKLSVSDGHSLGNSLSMRLLMIMCEHSSIGTRTCRSARQALAKCFFVDVSRSIIKALETSGDDLSFAFGQMDRTGMIFSDHTSSLFSKSRVKRSKAWATSTNPAESKQARSSYCDIRIT